MTAVSGWPPRSMHSGEGPREMTVSSCPHHLPLLVTTTVSNTPVAGGV
jgi:hypothetical protein